MGFVLRIWRYAVVVAAARVNPDPDARSSTFGCRACLADDRLPEPGVPRLLFGTSLSL
jgi:hypothetical protein